MKYRVYDIDEREYVTDMFYWSITPNGELCIDGMPQDSCVAEFSSRKLDKNGVEIFVGDIISLPAYGKGRKNSVVYFKDGKFAVDGSRDSFKDINSNAYEIVGNVHSWDGELKLLSKDLYFRSLYLSWTNPQTNQEFIVASLHRSIYNTNEIYYFEYSDDYLLAEQCGWRKLFAFPEDKEYESETMFPVFTSRLPDRNRNDIKEILKKYDLPSYDAFELLSRSGGRLPIDTYKFVDFKYPNSPYTNE